MIRWLGHATVRLDVEDMVIFFDPYDIKERAKADIICVSHEHFDHCSLDDLRMVTAKRTHVVGPPQVQGVLRRVTTHVHILEAGGEVVIDKAKITAVPAYNTDKPFHPPEAGGLGYIVEIGGKRYYFAGDTDLIPEMKSLRADVAILPVGGMYTMNAEEAAVALKVVGAKEGVPVHYGSIVGTGADGERFKRLIETFTKRQG